MLICGLHCFSSEIFVFGGGNLYLEEELIWFMGRGMGRWEVWGDVEDRMLVVKWIF